MTWTEIAWNVAYALLILAAGNLIGGWLKGVVGSTLQRTGLDPIVRRLLESLVRPVVLTLAAFAALQQLDIPITTFAAMAGAVTLAIGMSLQGSLSNVASGALLLTFRPFNVGDTIQAGGQTGKVHALHLFSTTLFTSAGQTVTLPNDAIWKGAITNFSDRPTRRIRLVFTLPADADFQKAEAALMKAMEAEERLLEDPGFSVVYDEATDLGLPLAAVAHTTNADYWGTLTDLQKALLVELKAAGITLSTRTR